jgi:hypothetical protein
MLFKKEIIYSLCVMFVCCVFVFSDNRMPCGMCCSYAICGMIGRTPTVEEFAWLSALDAQDRERLTFRWPAKEGECICCSWYRPAQYGNCCSTMPDMPFHDHTGLFTYIIHI